MENEKTVNFFDVDLSKEMLRLSIKKCMITSIDYRSSLSLSLSLSVSPIQRKREGESETNDIIETVPVEKGSFPHFFEITLESNNRIDFNQPIVEHRIDMVFCARFVSSERSSAGIAREKGRTDGRTDGKSVYR